MDKLPHEMFEEILKDFSIIELVELARNKISYLSISAAKILRVKLPAYLKRRTLISLYIFYRNYPEHQTAVRRRAQEWLDTDPFQYLQINHLTKQNFCVLESYIPPHWLAHHPELSLNWYSITNHNFMVTQEYLEKYPNLPWDFSCLTENCRISLEFMEAHPEIPWTDHLSVRQTKRQLSQLSVIERVNHPDFNEHGSIEWSELTVEIIRQCPNVPWIKIMWKDDYDRYGNPILVRQDSKLSTDIIETFPDWPWTDKDINYYSILTIDYLRRNLDRPWNMNMIFLNESLSEDDLLQNIDLFFNKSLKPISFFGTGRIFRKFSVKFISAIMSYLPEHLDIPFADMIENFLLTFHSRFSKRSWQYVSEVTSFDLIIKYKHMPWNLGSIMNRFDINSEYFCQVLDLFDIIMDYGDGINWVNYSPGYIINPDIDWYPKLLWNKSAYQLIANEWFNENQLDHFPSDKHYFIIYNSGRGTEQCYDLVNKILTT